MSPSNCPPRSLCRLAAPSAAEISPAKSGREFTSGDAGGPSWRGARDVLALSWAFSWGLAVGGAHAVGPIQGGAPGSSDEREPAGAPALSTSEATANSRLSQKVHKVGNIWLTTSNFGFFGDPSETFPDYYNSTDGLPGFVSCQFPARGGFDYLFAGGIWIGAIVGDDTLVSVGQDGWEYADSAHELFPGGELADTIQVSSIRYGDEGAVSEEDFFSTYTDTMLTSDFNGVSIKHRNPLNIRVGERSYAWSFSYAEDMVIFDYSIENMGLKTLRDVYMGIYLDGDVGPTPKDRYSGFDNAQDDVTGFRPRDASGKVINTAWLADYDSPLHRAPRTGDAVLAPSVMAVRVVRTPAKQLQTSYNWWFSDDDLTVDWGPGRRFPDGNRGTPDGDVNKYLIMKGWQNETLPDSLADPVTGLKRDPNQLGADKDGIPQNADDTRFLFSFGPFTVAPGEVLPITLGYFCAEHFYAGGDPNRIDYTDLDINARWVQFIFDNPNVDSPSFDYGEDGVPGTGDAGEGDGILDSGDHFYGEDVGLDGVPGTGDFGEGNGVLDSEVIDGRMRSEDLNLRLIINWIEPDPANPELSELDYLESISDEIDWELEPEAIMAAFPRLHLAREARFGYENGVMDEGDGAADFSGPPPPAAPRVKVEKPDANSLRIKWSDDSERFVDTFIPERSRQRDFQGYRLYMSRSGVASDFTKLLDLDLDRVIVRGEDGSPVLDGAGRPVSAADTLGRNTGFELVRNQDPDSLDYPYAWTFTPTLSNWPLYLAVTGYDNGYPPAKLASLESSIFASLVLATPSTPLGLEAPPPVRAVPNPYKINTDYSQLGWEAAPQSWTEFDRRMDFTNLKGTGAIQIYTVAGDLVDTVPHASNESRTSWNLISRNGQAVVAGLYLFVVEYDAGMAPDVGKFVIIK